MTTPSFVSEPQVMFLQNVLEEIREGQIQIPRFQRPFVWDDEQRKELLNSVRDGLPIGALMVWRTHVKDIACRDRLSPGYPLKSPSIAEGAIRQYLLDGQQRMTTLYEALFPASSTDLSAEPEEDEKGLELDQRAYLDLESNEFVWPVSHDSSLMPLDIVFDSIKTMRFLRKIPEKNVRFMQNAEQTLRAFREYKIAIMPLVSEDLATAALTFQRINSQGTRMSTRHMVHALTWSPTFDLQARIDVLKAKLLEPLDWDEIDDDRILDVCGVAMGMHAFDGDVDKLSGKLRARPEMLDVAVESIGRAATFFRDQCRIVRPDLVPFKEQIVLLAEAFRFRPEPTSDALNTLRAWLWMSTYTELFTGTGVYRRITMLTEDVRKMASDGVPRWARERRFERRPLPPGIDFRSARSKAFAIRLVERACETDPETPLQWLRDQGTYSIKKMLNAVLPHLRGNPGNQFLMGHEHANSLHHRLLRAPGSQESVALMRQHVVSSQARQYLNNNNFESFLQQRRRDLDALEDDFMKGLIDHFKGALPSGQ